MRRTLALLPVLTVIALGGTADELRGQAPLSLEVRGGMTVPVGEFDASRTALGGETSLAIRARALVHPTSFLALFAGWGREAFGCTPVCAAQGDLVVSGPSAGVRAILPHGRSPVRPWLEAGVSYASAEFTGEAPQAGYDRETGWEIGAGFDVPVGESVFLSPSFAYTALGTEVLLGEPGHITRESAVTYTRVELGARYRF